MRSGAKTTVCKYFLSCLFGMVPIAGECSEKLRALLIDGQMNRYHNMALMSDVVAAYLEETGMFQVKRVSTPPEGAGMAGFAPGFDQYDLVVLNYDGEEWPESTKSDFERYIRTGGGLVTVHSSDNAFPEWQAYNEMIGVGGWNGRDENWGPAVYWDELGMQLDHGPGQAFHPSRHEFPVTVRDDTHPVTSGMPTNWLHARDELYSCLRGPAKNMRILATGFANPALENSSGRHEPVLMALSWGEGRIFHTTLGHIGRKETELPPSVRCVGFISSLQRGAEWAATGTVTQTIPEEFPGPEAVVLFPNDY